jgi:phage terminase small subunit
MARGGFRPGAGRPRKSGAGGAVDKAAVAVKSEAQAGAEPAGEITPLEYLLSVVNDQFAEKGDRFKAAVAAAPYVHARASDLLAAKGKKEQKQGEAERVAGGKFAPRGGPKLAVVKG